MRFHYRKETAGEKEGMDLRIGGIVAIAMCSMATGASCKEYPIGQAQEKEGMHIAAVYLQPIEMDPPGMMRDAKDRMSISKRTSRRRRAIRTDLPRAIGCPTCESALSWSSSMTSRP